MKFIAHIVTIVALLAAFVAVPTLAFANVSLLMSMITGTTPDLISSASVIQASPDGNYVILLNTQRHSAENVPKWRVFFEGKEDAPLIMEDVSALTIRGDAAGIEMAESLQSRLAENQMKLRTEQAPIALSKGDAGLFDVIILSQEAYETYGAASVANLPYVEVIER